MKGLEYAHKISEWKTVATANFVISYFTKYVIKHTLFKIIYY